MVHNGILKRITLSKYSSFLYLLHLTRFFFRFGETNGIPNEAINHSADAITASLYTAQFFVNEARRNSHKFATYQDEEKALIYNYKPASTTGSFVQEYFFHF